MREKTTVFRHPIEEMFLDYIDLYNFIYRNRENILLIDFERLVSEPGKIVRAIAQFTKLDLASSDPIAVTVERAKQALSKRVEKPLRMGKKPITVLSLPVEERTKLKRELFSEIITHPLYANTILTYERLVPFLVK